jgi:hypothetical protein
MAINLALLLAFAGFALAAPKELPQLPLTAETLDATLLGGPRYDQVRFLQCVKNEPSTFGRMIAYYDHPPQGGENPTQVALKEFNSLPWGDGCTATGQSSDGAGWECEIDKYVWSEDVFRHMLATLSMALRGSTAS